MASKQFTLLNTGTGRLAIQSVTFNNPTGIGHTANLLNLSGSSAETGNASGLSYSLGVGESQTFMVDYSDTGAGSGTYNGTIVIGGSNSSSNTISATIVLAGASPPAPPPPPPPPAPSYTVTPASSSVNEGSSLTFNVSGSYIGDGTYYWTVTNSGDFGTASGSFTITGNSGSFNVTPTADSSTEGSETFTASIRSVSISGDILATSSAVTINDTSTAPAPPPTPPGPSPSPSPPPSGSPNSTTGFGGNYTFVKSTSGVASLTLRLDDDGGWRIVQASTGSFPAVSGSLTRWSPQITGNWYSPTTPGIGSSYLYRLTVNGIQINGAGTVTPGVTGPGSWLPFTGAAAGSVAITSGSGDEAIGDFTIEIAVNNSGSPGTIVSTTNFNYNGSRGI